MGNCCGRSANDVSALTEFETVLLENEKLLSISAFAFENLREILWKPYLNGSRLSEAELESILTPKSRDEFPLAPGSLADAYYKDPVIF